MKTFASLFSGGGGADSGAILAGLKPILAIENDPQIAEVYAANIKHLPLAKSIAQVNPRLLERPDVLWASPPCQAYSIARSKKLPPRDDADIGLAVIPFLEILQPQIFMLENVEGYRKSKSFLKIVDTLYKLNYWTQWQVLNAADFGVPQTRRRLILRAVKGAFVSSLPAKEKWCGWYEAIADLIPELQPVLLASWQLKRLQPEIINSFLIDSKNADPKGRTTVRFRNEPSFTICAATAFGLPKAVLIERHGSRIGSLKLRTFEQPAWTIRASIGSDGKGSNRKSFINALVEGEVLNLNIRSLARLQTFPDWYTFPESTALASRIIGNAVPPLMAKILIANTISS